MTSALTRINYASGYLQLGMVHEALEELEAVDENERHTAEYLTARSGLHLAEKNWDGVIRYARTLTLLRPGLIQGWISWAYALRELGRVMEAKSVLLEAEPLHSETHAVLHYNLACYHCLLGELAAARERLDRACRIDPEFRESAQEDPDLAGLRELIK